MKKLNVRFTRIGTPIIKRCTILFMLESVHNQCKVHDLSFFFLKKEKMFIFRPYSVIFINFFVKFMRIWWPFKMYFIPKRLITTISCLQPVTEFQLAGRLISGSKLHLLISTSLINLAYFLS